MINDKENSSFAKTFLKGEVSYGFFGVASRAVSIVNSLLIISALTLYQYGIFQLLLATYASVAVLIGLASGVVNNDILRFIGEKKEEYAKRLYYEFSRWRISIAVVLWVVTFFGAPLLSFRFGPEFITIIKIMSFLFLHEVLLAVIKSLLVMRMKFSVVASRSFITKVIQLGILLSLLYFFKLELTGVVLSLIIAAFASTLFLIPVYLKSYGPWRGLNPIKEKLLYKIILSYGKWDLFRPTISRLMSFVQPWLTKIVISTEAVAIFSVANAMISTLQNLLPTKTLSALIPRELNDKERSQKILSYGEKYLLVFSFLLAIGALIFVPPFVKILFPKYIVSLPYFYLLLLTLPFTAIGSVATYFVIALRKQKFLFFQTTFKNILMIFLLVILVPLFKIWGLAIKDVLMSLIMFSILYTYLRKVRPGVYIKWKEIFHFGKEDLIFLGNLYRDFKKSL